MIADVWTVMRKELRELVFQRSGMRGAGRGGWLNLAIIAVVFGIFLPLQLGREWITAPFLLIYWAWVPLFLVSSVIADSFAGERERHTLETLLASRLSDRAILFGKIAAGIVYGCGLTFISLLIGAVTVNIAHWSGRVLFYPAQSALGGVALSLLGGGLAATAGVIVSLRAASVRQAAQTMSLAIMVLLFVPIFGFQALPAAWKARLAQSVAHLDVGQAILIGVIALFVLDALALIAAMARFKRARLILD